jgi:hypothetical protein
MNTWQSICQRPYKMLAVLCVVLTFVLASCGAGSNSSGSGAQSGQTPTASTSSTPTVATTPTTSAAPTTPAGTPTTIASSGTSEGCPSQAVVNTTPAPAQVVVTTRTAHAVAHPGDTVEIRLPFGQKWSNPRMTQSNLTAQQPSGYASQTDKACIWRFVAKSAGTEQLSFTQQPLCKAGMACPMHIAIITFSVTVQ